MSRSASSACCSWWAEQGSTKDITGLDGALRTLLEQPFGKGLLTVVALGIACYGVYSLACARFAKV